MRFWFQFDYWPASQIATWIPHPETKENEIRTAFLHQQNRKPPIRWFIQKKYKKKKKKKEKQEAEVKPHFQGRCRIA